jgi:superfamily II DNA or RNA helicase
MPPAELRRGEIVRIRDERWSVSRHVRHAGAAVVEVRGCDRANRGVRARFLLPFDAFERLPAVRSTRLVSRRRWQRLASRVIAGAVPDYDSLHVLVTSQIDILPFQLEPALAIVRGLAARILIADEVGLGKTVQAGLIVAETLERTGDARVLVVCPAALREQWAEELACRFGLTAARLDSTALARLGSELPPGVNPWAAHPLIVTSVDYVKRPDVLRALEGLVWDLVVVDEAHGLAGRSDRHAASVVLGERARTLVMLTATPHSGDEEGFRRLCGIGSFDREFPLAVFRRTRQDAGVPLSRRTAWLAVRPTPSETEMHSALTGYAQRVWRQGGESAAVARLAMTVLLRRACSSAHALARSIDRRLRLLTDAADPTWQLALPFDDGSDDDEPVAELAVPGLADGEAERTLLEEILRLARAVDGRETKRRAIRRLLQRTAEPAIVFTEYRDTLAVLARELGDFGCVELHGGLVAAERRQVLQRFVSGASRILLATDAASEGLNLQEKCRLVIHLELPWTPVRLEQRVGRVDRIGQRKRVHQVLLVAAGTSEQSTIAPYVRERAARAEQTLAAMRARGADEREVANRIFGVPASQAIDRPVAALPDGVLVADLRDRAMDEAARATTARELERHASRIDIPIRPFARAVRSGGTRACWVFRVRSGPSDEEILWETIVGVWCAVDGRRFPDPAALLRDLEASRTALLPFAERQHAELLTRSASTRQAATSLAIAREQSIAAGLEHRHARLAASLLQRALFDRRRERESAMQRAVLREAVARCDEQMARLRRRLDAPVAMVEPAFAVILR